jgi:glucose/arabinose dehydrogenase
MTGTISARRALAACMTSISILVAWPGTASAQHASVPAAQQAVGAPAPTDLERWAPLLTRGVDGRSLAAHAVPVLPAPGGSACPCHSCDADACECGCAEDAAHNLPPGFYDQVVLDSLEQVTGFAFAPNGLTYLWEKKGRIRIMESDGTLDETPLLDISEEVANWGDHGLLSVALDPDFASNGRLYLLYGVDHYHAKMFGKPGYDPALSEPHFDTIGRLTRYTADPATGFRTVLPTSRRILLGEAITTGVPIEGTSHGVGTVRFGEDGYLLVSCGDGSAGAPHGNALADGIIKPKENIGAFRSQLVDCLSGKILRLDPTTGNGVPDNPFYDAAAPRAPRSRVWMLGLRNPCRFALQPGTGSISPAKPGRLAVADVGAEKVEEISIAEEPGANFGWPLYEGLTPGLWAMTLKQNLDAPNPLSGVGSCQLAFFFFQQLITQDSLNPPSWPNPCNPGEQITSAPTFVHHRPALEWLHEGEIARVPTYDAAGKASFETLGTPGSPATGETFGGNCSIAGAWYPGGSFPDEYDGALFHIDFGLGWMRVFRFDGRNRLVSVEPFADMVGKAVMAEVNPVDGSLWYLDYTTLGIGRLHVLRYSPDNLPPTAVAISAPDFGPAPVEAVFDGAQSSDPEGLPLEPRWTFSDGTPYSIFPSTTRSLPAEDITAQGTIVAYVLELIPPGSTGFSNHDIELIRDGVRPPQDTFDDQLQYDTIHAGAGGPDKNGLDWYGYTFAEPRTFTGLLLQEGLNYNGGGWFDTLQVQVRNGTTWTAVPGWTSDPPYPASLVNHFETFEIRIPDTTGDGIRLYGIPGGVGPLDFTTLAELRVIARPTGPPGPSRVDATLSVTDASGFSDVGTTSVFVDDTPPHVAILQPHTGDVYSTAGPTPVDCLAAMHDAETGGGSLECAWQVVLHHDNHTHPQPQLSGCTPSTLLTPEGGCNGDVFFQEVRCTVTDPTGMATTASAWIVPDCDKNLNGQPDAQDIASGTSRDHDADGVPDECQVDCNGNGIGDFYDIYFGPSLDADLDGVPDECARVNIDPPGKLPPKGPPKPLK